MKKTKAGELRSEYSRAVLGRGVRGKHPAAYHKGTDAKREMSLKQLLSEITSENVHDEVDTGHAVGNEAFGRRASGFRSPERADSKRDKSSKAGKK